MSDTPKHAEDFLSGIEEAILAASRDPDARTRSEAILAPSKVILFQRTGWRARYRQHWDRPDCERWRNRLERIKTRASNGGNMILIGNRGGGKTRLAAEACRDLHPTKCRYATAIGLFLRLRASFRRTATETEAEIVNELAGAPLLVLDELQERGESEWEDRILTHLIDERYARMLGTILIANLKPGELADHLGPSIADRMRETGGMVEITEESHRTKQRTNPNKKDQKDQ